DAGQVSNGDSTAGFVNGSSAYYLVGSWENNNMLDAFGEDGVSSFFIPTLEGSPFPNIGAGGPEIALSVTEYSENKELAGEFLRFLAEPANQDIFVELNQTQGSNHVDGDASKIQNPLLRQQFEQLAGGTDGVTFAFDSVMPQATIDLFYRVNAGVFLGTITPEDAVSQLAASYAQEIANQ
ncbi:MAG TPA: extracellular solute-binding protein, partial [Actinotalea sp.]|nr:extracellular solute-binding protein [Actinotalea sp.]